jgi:PPOX class probable F420-dependent enzyme
MELNQALAFAAGKRNALLTTLRRDGRPQQSMIFYLLDHDQFTISLTNSRAKVRNLRRDSRAALFIPSDDVFQWVTLDGTVTLSDVATDPDDAIADALVDYYQRTSGEHADWSEYRQAMVDDGRLVATFHATSAMGILPS